MLLRNKNLECIVPRRTKGPSTDAPPVAPPMAPSYDKEGLFRYKLLVFRMPESLKMAFKVSLLKNNLDIQHTFEAFAEIFISWTNGEKIPDPMKAVVRRSITLMNGV